MFPNFAICAQNILILNVLVQHFHVRKKNLIYFYKCKLITDYGCDYIVKNNINTTTKAQKTSPYGPPIPFKGNKSRFEIKHASPKARKVKDEIKILIYM